MNCEQMELELMLDEKRSDHASTKSLDVGFKSRSKRKKSQYSVVLVHEKGVNWRLDCFHSSDEGMDAEDYSFIAKEGLKQELLRLLKSDSPQVDKIHIISLVLDNMGVDLPHFLKVDSNKNLFEGDFWSDFEKSDRTKFKSVCSSYLWAFYFKQFESNEKVANREFIEFPTKIIDLLDLLDWQNWIQKYPGLKEFSLG